ncbi:MAG: 4-hydroxythreonine-4-phosphate dehydrogenase PdxA [Myxococcales bacterium]|nr:4-hydroxythreonine-4-phosphate dehydrogenase PdxA [Myxococcales bacterium]
MKLLITPGDPGGIGPEVTARALASVDVGDVEIVGDRAAVLPWLERVGVDVPVIEPAGDGPVEVRSIEHAVRACVAGEAGALVTGPIHKAKLAREGFAWPGHTDFLGHLTGVERPVMAFVGGRVRVALATVHLPLSAVPAALDIPTVEHTIRAAHRALVDQVGLVSPVLAVCGLNPHAGDEGLLGREEIEVIGPAVEACRADGIDARGPMSAESAFLPDTGFDLIVAMYHDQGLVPLKALDFGRTVNWTLGLPIVRTSVDHGTAYDLVGTGRASPASMEAALAWARRLVGG